ncbi:sugar phosphate isomerase/epimerase family protein [Clostridium sp. AM58-1XD]|uniref:sugar phosphate isomerase/epimerase family protein n=1 Tax=Clostridium sp. AM58-1XD TaxID=2292307 RepID=UPI000E47D075|nr:sugar phosphate isomerase/epimerase family protein [Clostridium sp. AM58-1XD]RGZ01210.1 sugar phosphate isomerase/epimerase [Clostridium sp. AM58-1XD]
MNKTRLGISSYTFPFACGTNKRLRPAEPLTPFTLIDKAAAYGLSVVQIADNMSLDALSAPEVRRLKTYSQERGISLETGFRGIEPNRFMDRIQLTRQLDSHLMRCVIDTPSFQPSISEVCAILKAIIPVLNEYNIVLGIENHDRFYSHEFAEIIETVGSRHVGIILDTANSLAREEPIGQVLGCLAKYTVCFHVKDYIIRRRNGEMGFVITGAPAGDGRLDIPYILQRLRKEAPCDFSTILESWMESLPGLEETLKQEEAWADQGVTFLKSFLN